MANKITKLMLNWEEYEIREYQWWGWGWWTPWANTIAYYPLDSTNTVNDLSGNWYNLTNTMVVFWNYVGVSCASFDWATSKLTATISTLPQWANARTISLWVYDIGWVGKSIMWYWANRTKRWCFILNYANSSEWYWLTPYYDDIYSYITTTSTWMLLTWTYDGTNFKLYINGELIGTSDDITLVTSWTNFEIWNPYDTGFYQWYASNAIIEDKARTAQEISEYFNRTKALYGIS